jgi:hypothetical protein
MQCCGAKTICFRSGADFQKVSAPAIALELPVITDFILKSTFSCFLGKKIDLIHMLDPIQYEFLYSIFRLRLQPKIPAPAPQHCLNGIG